MTITRRDIVLTGAGAVAAASVLRPKRARAAEFSYKYGHTTPASHPHNLRLVQAAERIARETNGALEIQVFPNSQLGGDNDLLSQGRSGAVEFCQPSGQVLSTLLPVSGTSALGFVFDSYDKVWQAMDGDLGRFIQAQIRAKAGLVPMDRMWDLGFRQVTTSVRPIRTAADLAGLKIRTPVAASLVSVFTALKAAPVGIQFAEAYSALATRIVDGQENPLSIVEVGKFYEVQKYCSMTNHVWDGYWICANARAWNRLPADMQAIVARSFNETAPLQRADNAALNISTRDQISAKGIVFNDTEPASFRQQLHVSGFYAEWRRKLGDEAWSLLERNVGTLS